MRRVIEWDENGGQTSEDHYVCVHIVALNIECGKCNAIMLVIEAVALIQAAARPVIEAVKKEARSNKETRHS